MRKLNPNVAGIYAQQSRSVLFPGLMLFEFVDDSTDTNYRIPEGAHHE